VKYLLAAGVIFGVNLLPAFGPPTWTVLVFFRLNSNLAAVPLVLIGAVAAAVGRFALANAARRFRSRLSARRRANVEAAQSALLSGRGRSRAALALFALSPLPSAQLFVAAGLMEVPLLPLTAAFFAGRLVSYSLYMAGASAAKASLGSVLTNWFTSPLGIATQMAMLAGVFALTQVDWAKRLKRG
jgi:uncharacterized membrane protein YdjX (TVP38/TMEM64 family)